MAKRKKNKQELESSLSPSSLKEIREALRKQFGMHAVKTYTEAASVPTVPTGILSLDKSLGGGVPLGRLIELYGEASSGKTTLTLSIMAQAQKLFPNKHCVYIDAEHALDLMWAEKVGINLAQFDHCNPNYGEDAIEMIEAYLKSDDVSIIALDSVAALLPKVEMDEDVSHANIGVQARLVSTAMRRINSILIHKPQSAVIFINQKRAQLSGGGSFDYEATKTTGGKALPFYMTTRLALVKIKTLKDSNGVPLGQIVKVDVIKNKVNKGHGSQLTFQIMSEYGIDAPYELLTWALDKNKINQAGTWYSVIDTGEKAQGEQGIKNLIREKYQEEWTKEALSE